MRAVGDAETEHQPSYEEHPAHRREQRRPAGEVLLGRAEVDLDRFVHRLAVLLPAPRPLAVRVGAWTGGVLLVFCTYTAGFWYVRLVGTMDRLPPGYWPETLQRIPELLQ